VGFLIRKVLKSPTSPSHFFSITHTLFESFLSFYNLNVDLSGTKVVSAHFWNFSGGQLEEGGS
jgi:hypothetical protein